MLWGADINQRGLGMANLLDVLLASLVFSPALSQQLQGQSQNMLYPGLSKPCQEALNTNVSCPWALSPLAQNPRILDEDGVEALCVESCLSSLQSAKSIIETACTATTDFVVQEEVAYPATFFTYDVSCRKDGTTGQFCDPQLLAWSNQNTLTTNESCSDCWLGVQVLQLANPLGYDPGLASDFASLTSSCNVTAYSYVSPTAYALNTTATTLPATVTATPASSCTGSYTVKSADTCFSVSQALNVSTYSLLYHNNLDIYCQNFNASVGLGLCIPPQCETYTWQALDTCNSVVSDLIGITITQFLAWNPNLNSLCQNSAAFTGYEVCIGPPGGLLNYTTRTNLSVTITASVVAPFPTNAMMGSNKDCAEWYTIIEGDTCGLVSLANSLSLSDFLFLNSEVNGNCTNLDLGIAYCVKAVGAIQTYSGYTVSSSLTITVPQATFPTVNTAIPSASSNPGYVYTSSQLPTASGTIPGCDSYQNHDESDGFETDCSYIAFAYQVTTDDLLDWNPGLSSNLSACNLQSGYSYCVEQPNSAIATSTSNCIPVNTTTILPGTASTCDCFMLVYIYDNGSYGCSNIESDYSITIDQLLSWNKWLSPKCDTNLYTDFDTDAGDTRPVCVGVNSSAPMGTATLPPTSTPLRTETKSASSMDPTQNGVVAGCQVFHSVQPGDTCASIDTIYNISFQELYQWNPSVGSDCENLWLGYAYCVEGPALVTGPSSPTNTTSNGPTTPTQSGIVSNCDEYYKVASGDSCSKIEMLFNDTFTELYQWNPSIGDSCENLLAGYAVCVGVST